MEEHRFGIVIRNGKSDIITPPIQIDLLILEFIFRNISIEDFGQVFIQFDNADGSTFRRPIPASDSFYSFPGIDLLIANQEETRFHQIQFFSEKDLTFEFIIRIPEVHFGL